MMATSGLVSRIHSCDFSKPANTRFQYGSSVLLLSMAAPMAGTCDEPIPATILATGHFRFACFVWVFDLVSGLGLALVFSLVLSFGLVLFLAAAAFFGAAPPMNGDGAFLPDRERLPSTERPPPSIILA